MRRLARPAPAVGPRAAPATGQDAAPGYRRLAIFVAPLVFTGLMMTTDTPIANAAMARLPHAQESLAALVIAFSLALVYEAPHIMMIEAGTTLATNRQALSLLRRFYGRLALIVGVAGAAIVFSPLYNLLVQGVMNIPADVADAARPTLAVFLLWPLPIGWRRLHQGALIRHGQSRAVGAGAFARIFTLVVVIVALVPTLGGVINGSTIGALAMLASVTAESLYTHWSAGRLLANLPATAPDGRHLTMRELWTFYWPLAGTSILNTLNRPILSAGLAAAAVALPTGLDVDAALAAWGVAWGILYLVNGATLTLGQVAIAWDADPRAAVRRRSERLIIGLGLVLSGVVALAVLSPVAAWLLDAVYVVSPAVRAAALPVLSLLVPLPLLMATDGLMRGKLIHRRQTRLVQRAQIIDLAVLAAMLLLGIVWLVPAFHMPATTLGALAMLVVNSTDAFILGLGVRANPRALALAPGVPVA